MQRSRKAILVLGALGVLVAAFLVVLLLGAMQPRAHTSTVATVIDAPQVVVWQRVSDIAQQPTWRSNVTAIQPLPPQNGHTCWDEVDGSSKLPLCELVSAAPATRIDVIADPKLPYGGTWTYELTAVDANHTRLSITENGTTNSILSRFANHYLGHEDSLMKQYEADLKKSIGKA